MSLVSFVQSYLPLKYDLIDVKIKRATKSKELIISGKRKLRYYPIVEPRMIAGSNIIAIV